MNEYFDDFYHFKGFGPAFAAVAPSAETLNFYRHKLPPRLLEYWQEYGFCGWGEGAFWTVEPGDYRELLHAWLAGTPFEGQDNFHVIGRGAFGTLLIWGETSGLSLEIEPCYGMIFPTASAADKLRERGPDLTIDLFYACLSKDSLDLDDADDKPLFQRALARLGPLRAEEMYGFVPALALGGAPKLANLQKVNLFDHLLFLAELGEKQIMADIVALSNALHK
ncbi:GAD-like domain-containing protein [Shewanella chilikensis]|uniref:GAD-like domain-containing protein n=1 Tax=Shewanella chilikensis TaxID=558541 RepID=UPI003006D4A4